MNRDIFIAFIPLILVKLKSKRMKAGAYGNWRKINERVDLSIVRQVSEKGVSCVSAVGEMLLKSRNISATQAEILDIIGEPAGIAALGKCLNRFDVSDSNQSWHADYSNEFDINFLISKKNFAVILKEFGGQAHAVFIRKFNGRFIINDTFDQSSYEMTVEDFDKVWTGAYIYYGKNE